MEYVETEGLKAIKAELVALLAFVGVGKLHCVEVAVHGSSLDVRASDGHSRLSHKGDATDGSGGQSTAQLEWTIGGKSIQAITKVMGPGDEVLFRVSEAGRMGRAIVRDIESGESSATLEIANDVSPKLSMRLESTNGISVDAGSCASMIVAPMLLARLAKVAKAAGSSWCKQRHPLIPTDPIRYEFAGLDELHAGGLSRWTALIMPAGED